MGEVEVEGNESGSEVIVALRRNPYHNLLQGDLCKDSPAAQPSAITHLTLDDISPALYLSLGAQPTHFIGQQKEINTMRAVRFGLRAFFVYFLVAAKEVESFAPSGSRTSCYLLSQHHISTLQKGGQPTNNFNGDMQYTHPSSDYRGIFNNNAYSSNRCTTSLKMSTSPAVATTSTIVPVLQSLHGNNSFVLSALLVLAGIGIAMEQKTTFGKALSVSSL